MTPALDRLKQTLEAIDEPAWCEGIAKVGTLALAVPGGELCTAEDPRALVDWLTARAEPAPFGHKNKTKLDPNVRSTLRLAARGEAIVHGLDVGVIVERIEEALGASQRITATLLDVLVYPVGGKFLRHKDTPRTGRQLGTLIVEVPVPHQGGALELTDGREHDVVDWSGPVEDASKLRWVALFGDVDHTIEEITSGTRVTLVYTLALSETPRTDPAFAARLDAVADAIITLMSERQGLPKGNTLYIPCTRMIVAPTPPRAKLGLDVLRGHDRAIADTFARCGVEVQVCELLIPTGDDDDGKRKSTGFPQGFWGAVRVTKPIPEEVFAGDALSFVDDAGGEYIDEGEEIDIPSLQPYVERNWIVEPEAWLVREKAQAKVVFEGLMSETGYFGNECADGHVYQCAALEVTLPKTARSSKKGTVQAAKPRPKPRAKAKAKAKRAAKPKAKASPKKASPKKASPKKASPKKKPKAKAKAR